MQLHAFLIKYKFKTRRFRSLKLHIAEYENQIKLKDTQHTQALQ